MIATLVPLLVSSATQPFPYIQHTCITRPSFLIIFFPSDVHGAAACMRKPREMCGLQFRSWNGGTAQALLHLCDTYIMHTLYTVNDNQLTGSSLRSRYFQTSSPSEFFCGQYLTICVMAALVSSQTQAQFKILFIIILPLRDQ